MLMKTTAYGFTDDIPTNKDMYLALANSLTKVHSGPKGGPGLYVQLESEMIMDNGQGPDYGGAGSGARFEVSCPVEELAIGDGNTVLVPLNRVTYETDSYCHCSCNHTEVDFYGGDPLKISEIQNWTLYRDPVKSSLAGELVKTDSPYLMTEYDVLDEAFTQLFLNKIYTID